MLRPHCPVLPTLLLFLCALPIARADDRPDAGPDLRDARADARADARIDGGTDGALKASLLLESQNHCLQIARRYATLLLSGKLDEAQLLHDEEGGRRPDLGPLKAAIAARGEQSDLVDLMMAPVAQTGAEITTYFLTARFAAGPDLPVRVSVDHAGHVAGAACGPQAIVPARFQQYDRYDHYVTRTFLTLPFRGTWTAGNASPGLKNGHFLNANQRFAIDWFVVQGQGSAAHTYHNRGRDNADYYAYGQEVVAPASGKVVQVVDGVPDNVPGKVDVYFRLGNIVVLDLGHKEYAFLCHLLPGSITVRPGQQVRRGQVLARCGNSGNSTEPHLHFQLTDGPLITQAASLPVLFRHLLRNDMPADRIQPQDGERLAPR